MTQALNFAGIPSSEIFGRAGVRLLLSSISDNFNDNIRDTTLWATTFGTTSEIGGRARINCDTGFNAYRTAFAYTLSNASFFARLYPPAVGGGSNVYIEARTDGPTGGTDAGFQLKIDLNQLQLTNRVGFADGSQVNLTYDPVAHAWVRLRESAGTLFWDTSADGLTWVNQRTATTPAWATSDAVAMIFQSHRNSGTTDFAEVDNFNISTAVVSPAGVVSHELLGAAAITTVTTLAPSGINSGEAAGASAVTTVTTVAPFGIASSELLGAAVIKAITTLAFSGIASGEAAGTAAITANASIAPYGIRSGESVGAATVTALSNIAPFGIASEELLGALMVQLVALYGGSMRPATRTTSSMTTATRK